MAKMPSRGVPPNLGLGARASLDGGGPGRNLPSGEHTKSNGKWPFIVDFPIEHGDFPWQNVSSPEGITCLIEN